MRTRKLRGISGSLLSDSTFNRRTALKFAGGGAAALAGAHRITRVGPAQDAEVTLRYQNHWTKTDDAHYEGMNWLYEAFGEAHPNIHDANATKFAAGYLLDRAPYLDADPEWKAVLDPNVLGTTTTDGKIWALSG